LQASDVLEEGGRIAIITFHSLEDRIVKNFFKNGNFDEVQENDLYGTVSKNDLKIITKKPVTPAEDELKKNPRSRSSKLRIAEKIEISKKIT
jgi:16S rRNA (cytosine1402-N4)-methyltransferase